MCTARAVKFESIKILVLLCYAHKKNKAKIISKDPTTPEDTSKSKEGPDLLRLWSRTNPIDYRKLDNPKSRLPSLNVTSQSPTPPPDVSRPTEASKAKNKNQEQANLALENLYKKIMENIQEYSFSALDQGDLKTVDEALVHMNNSGCSRVDTKCNTLGGLGGDRNLVKNGWGPFQHNSWYHLVMDRILTKILYAFACSGLPERWQSLRPSAVVLGLLDPCVVCLLNKEQNIIWINNTNISFHMMLLLTNGKWSICLCMCHPGSWNIAQ